MQHNFKRTVIIDLGGSIVYPDTIDVQFVKKFHAFILKSLKQGTRFIIVIGGGRVARQYQEAAHAIVKVVDDDKDWLGIHATRINAHLLRTIFRSVADPVVIDQRYKVRKLVRPVTIASGWHPGWSTDFIAMALAEDFEIPEVVVAGKPDRVYDKDPSKYKNAKAFNELPWKEYRKLVPKKWIPGLSAPVDPVAAKLGEEKGIAAIVINGKDLKNFEKLLSGKKFKGTIIK